MERSIGRIIAKLIFYGLEVLTAWLCWMTISSYNFEKDFWVSLGGSLVCAYFFSIIVLILVWIFNFANTFDDYDSFSDGLFCCFAVAPITLAFHLIKHPINILKCIIFGENPRKTRRAEEFEKFAPGYENKENKEVKEDHRTDAWLIDHLKQAAWEVTRRSVAYRSGYRAEWHQPPDILVFLGKITIRGTIVVKPEYEFIPVDNDVLKDFKNATEEKITEGLRYKIEELRSKYKNYDREYNISIQISARWR